MRLAKKNIKQYLVTQQDRFLIHSNYPHSAMVRFLLQNDPQTYFSQMLFVGGFFSLSIHCMLVLFFVGFMCSQLCLYTYIQISLCNFFFMHFRFALKSISKCQNKHEEPFCLCAGISDQNIKYPVRHSIRMYDVLQRRPVHHCADCIHHIV